MNSLGENFDERSPAPICLSSPLPHPLHKEASYVFHLALAQNRSLFHEWRKWRRSQGGLYCAVYPETPESLFRVLNALGFWEWEAPKCDLRIASGSSSGSGRSPHTPQYSVAVHNPICLVQIGDYQKNPHYSQMVGFLDLYFPSWKKAPVEMP